MKYYSDMTKKIYDTEADLLKAEKAEEDRIAEEKKALAAKEAEKKLKAEERGKRADEVHVAYEKYNEARKNYIDLLNKFCVDYGHYHRSIDAKDIEGMISSIFSWPW